MLQDHIIKNFSLLSLFLFTLIALTGFAPIKAGAAPIFEPCPNFSVTLPDNTCSSNLIAGAGCPEGFVLSGSETCRREAVIVSCSDPNEVLPDCTIPTPPTPPTDTTTTDPNTTNSSTQNNSANQAASATQASGGLANSSQVQQSSTATRQNLVRSGGSDVNLQALLLLTSFILIFGTSLSLRKMEE